MHLVLNSFGSALGVKNGMFHVIGPDSNSTYPTEKIKTISLRKGIKISSNALYLAIENEIEVLLLDRSGKPFGRLWSNKFGSISTIRRKQVDWCRSSKATQWIKQIVTTKIENQAVILSAIYTNPLEIPEVRAGLSRIESSLEKMNELPKQSVISDIAARIRGLEGAAGKQYWQLVSGALPQKFRFAERSQHPATDAFNCLLNYAYGMLYSVVEGELIKAGLDPYLGVLHRDEYNRPTLVYDFIEPFRVWADYLVIDLCQQEAIGIDSFQIENNGFWLEGYGKRILVQCFNDYLDDVIEINGLSRSRRNQIAFRAQKLARAILNYEPESGKETDGNAQKTQDEFPF